MICYQILGKASRKAPYKHAPLPDDTMPGDVIRSGAGGRDRQAPAAFSIVIQSVRGIAASAYRSDAGRIFGKYPAENDASVAAAYVCFYRIRILIPGRKTLTPGNQRAGA